MVSEPCIHTQIAWSHALNLLRTLYLKVLGIVKWNWKNKCLPLLNQRRGTENKPCSLLCHKSEDWERRMSLQTVLAPKSPHYRGKSGFHAENPCRIWSGALDRILMALTLFKPTWRSTQWKKGEGATAGQGDFWALLASESIPSSRHCPHTWKPRGL